MENKSLNLLKAWTKYRYLSSYLRNMFCLLLMLCVIPQLHAKPEKIIVAEQQQSKIKVSGNIVDERGEPVIGASIIEEGTTNGIIADLDGNFNITVSPDATLRITFLGYLTQKIQVKGQPKISITMKEDSKSLDEVIVVGYGTQRVKDLTGAATPVKMDDLANLPGASIIDALSGQVIGLNVQKSSGRPGAFGTLSVREPAPAFAGGTTFGPLIVIDDVVQVDQDGNPTMEGLNMLDYSEIENMTVLKDASAAIYGSRSSQGVILVKTKRGSVGAPKISYSALLDFSDAVSHTKTMNAYETGLFTNRMYNQITANGGTNYSGYLYSNKELEDMKSLNYDWLDRAWSSAVSHRHSLTVNGGSDKITFFAGVSYQDQNTNLGNVQEFDKWTFRAGGEMKVTAGLKLSATIGGFNTSTVNVQDQAKIASGPWGSQSSSNDYAQLRHMPNYIPMSVSIADKEYWVSPWAGPHTVNTSTNSNIDKYSIWNFFANEASNARKMNENNGYNANFSLTYDVPFIKGLSLKAMYAINYSNTLNTEVGDYYTLARATNTNQEGLHLLGDETVYNFVEYGRGNSNQPRVIYKKNTTKNEQMNFMLMYNRTFGKHDVSATAVVERGESEGNTMQLQYFGPWDSYNGVSNSAGTLSTAGKETYFTKNESGSLSYIGRMNYKYAERYLFQFLIRTDASTKFAPENYWGTFPTGSVGWVLSEEKFYKNSKLSNYIDFLKLRFSLGKTGKDNLPAWKWITSYTVDPSTGLSFGENGGAPSFGAVTNGIVNRNIKWDTTIKQNYGLDMNFLSGRLAATVDYFYDKTKDMLVKIAPADQPIYLGTNLPYVNYGKVDAWGWEFSLRWNDRIKQSLKPSWGAIKYSVGVDYAISWHEVKLGEEVFFDYPGYINNESNMTGYRSPANTYGLKVWKNTSSGDGILRTQADIDNYWQYLTDLATAAGGNPSYLGIASKSNMYPGMIAYQDQAGDIDADNKTIAGPNGIISRDHGQDEVKLANDRVHTINTRLGFQWGNFSWSALIGTSWGGYASIDNGIAQTINNSTMIMSQFSYVADMFDPTDNPYGKYPSMAVASTYGITSDFWQVSSFRSYVKNMSMAYSLPKKALKNTGIDKLQISLTGNNLWDFYNPYPKAYRNMYDKGNTGYPTLRTWTMGVNVVF